MPDDLDPVPPDLASLLRKADAPPGPVSVEVDAAILRNASIGLGRRRRVRRMILAAAALSAAACVAVLGTLWFSAGSYDPNDLNRDGNITIADAFTLARKRASGDASITQSQIDQLAMLSVRLAPADGGGGKK